MNRTLESILNDIDLLGINGGYDVEQLLTPNDCRILKQELQRKDNIIDKAINKVQYIIDIGFDYDGYNDVDNLRKIIDELVRIAYETKKILEGKDNDI